MELQSYRPCPVAYGRPDDDGYIAGTVRTPAMEVRVFTCAVGTVLEAYFAGRQWHTRVGRTYGRAWLTRTARRFASMVEREAVAKPGSE